MRAIRLEEFVPPSGIAVADVPMPPLQTGDALVRVMAAGVNPSDVKYAGGIVKTSLLPRTPGRDFAGVVEQAPEHPELVGKAVFGSGGDLGISRDGTHAEYVALPAAALALKPEKLTMAQASAAGVPFVTAYLAVAKLAEIQAGETLCLIGASGSVGTAAAQIAKWRGARVIGTRRRRELEHAAEMAVERWVTLPDDDLGGAVMDFTGGKGADAVFNMVGGETFEAGVNILGHYGRMVCIAATGERRVSFDLMHFYKWSMRWYGLDTLELTASETMPTLRELAAGFESGALSVEIAKSFPLEQASAAYGVVSRGGTGKVVLDLSVTS